jgi:hypothetical protein
MSEPIDWDKRRAEFEAQMIAQGYTTLDLRRPNKGGNYISRELQIAWAEFRDAALASAMVNLSAGVDDAKA